MAPLSLATYITPPQHTAKYAIDKGPLTVARATTKFYPLDNSGYLYRLHLRTTGVASLFSGTRIRERSVGRITEDGYRPERYVYNRSGDDEAEHTEVDFNWRTGNAQGGRAAGDWGLAIPQGTLDRVVSPLQLMHDLSVNGEANRRMTYDIADDGELKSYEITIGDRETVHTAAGRFEAVRVVRRSENGDRKTRLWCAPTLDYLPVKVTRIDDGDRLELELESLDGFGGDP